MGGRPRDVLFYAGAAVCAALGLAAIWRAVAAPVPDGMDLSQKIFFFHVPSAIAMYAGLALCCVGSLGYLLRGTEGWDATGKVGAELATLLAAVVLVTGPIWARQAWGAPWVWDPRLTGVAVLALLLAAYHLVRAVGEDGPAARRLAAALGTLAAPNAYLIHVAVRMWGGHHPTVIYDRGGMEPVIATAFGLCLATVLLAFGLLACWLVGLELDLRRARGLELETLVRAGR